VSLLAWIAIGVATANAAATVSRAASWSPRARRLGVAGAALTAGALLALVAVAGPLARNADVSGESAVMAAGLVLAAGGLVRLVLPARPVEEPDPAERAAWAVPIAFPDLLRPEVALFALAAALRLDAAGATVSVLVGAATLGAAFLVPARPPRLWLGLDRLLSAGQVLGGVALVLDGIRSV
jgi:hypothetical protein